MAVNTNTLLTWSVVGLSVFGLVYASRKRQPLPELVPPPLPTVPDYRGLAVARMPVAEFSDREQYSEIAGYAEPHEHPEAVTDQETLQYQLDELLDDLQHLETEHLPAKGLLMGKPCDCMSKAARDLRRHARETIPIAARQGKDPALFDRIAAWADKFVRIGTAEEVGSGRHTDEYLRGAGEASSLRKELNQFAQNCKPCAARAQQMKALGEKLKALPPAMQEKVRTLAQKVNNGEMTAEEGQAALLKGG
ncbi:MAG: hypothetical protein Q8R28_08395 [Dehalococcoidia bacterium]|nr:hypothetical protein [Dehalococcoidia bacterium]